MTAIFQIAIFVKFLYCRKKIKPQFDNFFGGRSKIFSLSLTVVQNYLKIDFRSISPMQVYDAGMGGDFLESRRLIFIITPSVNKNTPLGRLQQGV